MKYLWILLLAAPFAAGCAASPPTKGVTPPSSSGTNQITGWGDSLTSGGEDGGPVTWPNVLQKLTGLTVNNEGVGQQTSTQIAVRQGGVPTSVTVAGNQIPASGPVTIAFPAGYEPVTDQNSYQGYLGTILGVPGSVTEYHSVYSFTRTAPGSAVTVPPGTAFVPSNGTLNNGFVVIWAGRNDYQDESQVLSDIAAMVASLPTPKRFLVMSVLNEENDDPNLSQNEYANITGYHDIIALNAALAAAYPHNYLDIRALLVSDYNPANPLDAIDHTNDVPPYSLRAVDIQGMLTNSIDSSTCNIGTSVGMGPGSIISLGPENIYVSATTAAGRITNCFRGYGGSPASSHASGQIYIGTDPLHLNGAGYTYVANQIYKWMQANPSQ